MASLLFRIERESHGRVRVCRTVADIERCLADDALAAVLHIEGAEAIDANFELLGRALRGGAALTRPGVEPAECVRPRRAIPLPVFARHRPRSD